MSNVNKADIIKSIAEEMGVSQSMSAKFLEVYIEVICSSVRKKKDVRIMGFGTFAVEYRKERQSRNPQTGKIIDIPAKYVVKFKTGKLLNDSMSSCK